MKTSNKKLVIRKVKSYKDIKIQKKLIEAGGVSDITIKMMESNVKSHLPMFVAYYNNKPVGQCCARPKIQNIISDNYYDEFLKTDTYIVLSFINVLNKYRSKGIGSLLLEKYIDNSFLKVLRVKKNNANAYSLYSKFGFKKIKSYIDLENEEWHALVYSPPKDSKIKITR